MSFLNKFSGKQLTFLFTLGLILTAVVIRPELATSLIPWGQQLTEEQLRQMINEEVEDYLEQDIVINGTKYSPWQTEKPYDYIINEITIGVTDYAYLINGKTGKMDDYSSDQSNVFKWAEGNLSTSGGTIYVVRKNYGIGSSFTHYRKTSLISDGATLTATANFANAMIVIDDGSVGTNPMWSIKGFRIDLNGYNGDGVAGEYWGRGEWVVEQMLVRKVQSSYAGFDIEGYWRGHLRDCHIALGASNATGVRVTNSGSGSNEGEGQMSRIQVYNIYRSNCKGFHFLGDESGSLRTNNMITGINLIVGGGTPEAGSTGFLIESDEELTFFYTHVEGAAVGYHFDASQKRVHHIYFHAPTYLSKSSGADVGWRFTGNVDGCVIFGGETKTYDGVSDAVDDDITTGDLGVQFIGHKFWENANNAPTFATTSSAVAYHHCTSTSSACQILDYQVDTGTWSDPIGPVWDGRVVRQCNSGQTPDMRLCVYDGVDNHWEFTNLGD